MSRHRVFPNVDTWFWDEDKRGETTFYRVVNFDGSPASEWDANPLTALNDAEERAVANGTHTHICTACQNNGKQCIGGYCVCRCGSVKRWGENWPAGTRIKGEAAA